MIEESRDFVDALHRGRRVIDGIAGELDRLADSFEETGNTTVAERLATIAQRIVQAYEDVDKAFGRKLAAEVKDATAGIGLTLKAILDMTPDHPLNQPRRTPGG